METGTIETVTLVFRRVPKGDLIKTHSYICGQNPTGVDTGSMQKEAEFAGKQLP